MAAEVLPYFQNAAVVDRVGDGAVLVVLENRMRRICEAEAGSIHTLFCSPVLKRKPVGRKTVCSLRAAYDRCSRQQVLVHRPRQVGGVDINVAERDRQPISNLTLDSQRSLLRLRASIIGLAKEEHSSRRKRASVIDLQIDRRRVYIPRRDAGILPGRRCAAQNLPLSKKYLVDRGRVLVRI